MDLSELRSRLSRHSQEHLLRHWDRLDEDGKARLYRDVDSIDLEEVDLVYKEAMGGGRWASPV